MQPSVNLLIAKDIASSALPDSLKQQKTDVRHFILPQLGINEVRYLTDASARKSLGEGDYVFVVLATTISIEAQNAMLKLFEEPPVKTIFYLIIPAESILLPTLRSRFIMADNQYGEIDTTVGREFISLGYAERLEIIAAKAKSKDFVWMENLVTTLGYLDKTQNLSTNFKRSLLLSESYFRIRGAGRKMLLEELALALPVSS